MSTKPLTDLLAATPDGATATVTGRITAAQPRETGQGTRWAVITIGGDDGAATVHVPPRYYLQYKHLLAVGARVTAAGLVSQWREPVMSATSIRPADRDAQTAPPADECQLCGAPGGYPYCNTACEAADNPDDE